jgi:hypothetical protein
VSGYIFRVIVAFDILLMALCNGKRNETISSCAWSMEQNGKLLGRILRPLIDFLVSPWEDHHCATSYFVEQRK